MKLIKLCVDKCKRELGKKGLNKRLRESKYLRAAFYKNNLAYFLCIFVYVLVQVGLVIIQYFSYKETNNTKLIIARIGGILLDFNCSFMILLVLRRLTTWLRNSYVGRFLPMDDFLEFHKFIGYLILMFSFMHTIAHCVNLYYLSSEHVLTHLETAQLTWLNSDHLTNASNAFNVTVNGALDKTANSSFASLGSYGELLFTTKSKIGWVFATAMPTGWILLIILLIIVIFALPCFRQKGYFEVFYLTHWLHIVFYAVLFVHATHFWKWFVGPFLLAVLERLFTCYRLVSKNHGDNYIKEVNLLASKVTHLVITRPKDFKFKSGDYLMLRIPKIARYEWHPFSISSAPEKKDELWLHIRSLGNWTNKVNEYFTELAQNQSRVLTRNNSSKTNIPQMSNMVILTHFRRRSSQSLQTVSDLVSCVDSGSNSSQLGQISSNNDTLQTSLNKSNKLKDVWMKVMIDGPFSTSSRSMINAEHAILIAGGIGVTPFASILQSLWIRYANSLKTCQSCNSQWYDDFDKDNLKQVDFIWVNRDYQAFEWFVELLGQLELQQINSRSLERFINIHLYMTSAKCVQEIKPNVYSELNNAAQIQEFSLKLRPGRPDLDQIFADIDEKKKGKITVYFCGSREFGKQVQKKALKNKFKFSREYFSS